MLIVTEIKGLNCVPEHHGLTSHPLVIYRHSDFSDFFSHIHHCLIIPPPSLPIWLVQELSLQHTGQQPSARETKQRRQPRTPVQPRTAVTAHVTLNSLVSLSYASMIQLSKRTIGRHELEQLYEGGYLSVIGGRRVSLNCSSSHLSSCKAIIESLEGSYVLHPIRGPMPL